jgi:hypothetical protein
MPKAKAEARPFYQVKHEFLDAQSRFDLAVTVLFNDITIIREHWMGGIPEEALKQLDKHITEFKAAAYGED